MSWAAPPTLVLALALAAAWVPGCSQEAPDDGTPSPPAPPPAPPGTAGPLALSEVAANLTQPLWMVEHPALPGTLLVAEQQGRIQAVAANASTLWLDLTDRVGAQASEQGLLGFAFHPDFAANGVLVVSYTDTAGDSRLARLVLANRTAPPDRAAAEILLTVDQPFDNHNGGHALWGPDGHLYFGLGDGGLAGDPALNGQRRETLLGSLLRIDVGPTGPYSVPADNPFVDDPLAAPEVWAYGLRNPWRFHFDAVTGDLWIGDVGQNVWEEVDLQPAGSAGGENYGWNLFEGNHQFPSGVDGSATAGFVFPVAVLGHCSVTMGPVVRDPALPGLAGHALWADFCSGRMWHMAAGGVPEVLLESGLMVSSFAEDSAGRVYVMDYAAGRLLRLVPG